MNQEILKTVGQIAGLGGIALGVLLILFREVIRKNIFPDLTKDAAYKLLRLIVVLVWSISIVGIAAWVYVSTVSQSHLVTSELSLPADSKSRNGNDDKVSDVTSHNTAPKSNITPRPVATQTLIQKRDTPLVKDIRKTQPTLDESSKPNRYTVRLLIPSELNDANVLVDGKPVEDIGRLPTFLVVAVKAKSGSTSFQIIGKRRCGLISQLINKDVTIIPPCS